MRIGVRSAMYLGNRTLLAMTCRKCGVLKSGSEFVRRWCNGGYCIDRRCRPCKWVNMETSVGR